MKELKMAEAKGLMKPVKLKKELAELLGATELPRTEITKKLWDYIKANKLQTKTENGKPENAGKFIVADDRLLSIFKNTKSKSKSGKVTDLTNLRGGPDDQHDANGRCCRRKHRIILKCRASI